MLYRFCFIQRQVNIFNILDKVTEISGFRRDVDVAFALLRRNAVYVGFWLSKFRDSAYGSTFFVATGFHGLHVIIGTTFLTTCLLRHITLHFSSNHHFGFEAAARY